MTEPTKPPSRTVEDLITRITEGDSTVLDVAGDGNEKHVTFTLQRIPPDLPEQQPRAETPARAHAFYEALSFAAYLARYGTRKDVVVYVDPSTETAWGTVSETNIGGVETLVLKPQLHPLWRPWQDLAARGRVPLEAFREHLNLWRRAVKIPDGRALALTLAKIRGAVEITIHDGRGKDALNGIVIRSTVQGQETKEYEPLPEELVLEVPLYVGGEVQRVELDLVVDADNHGNVTIQIAAGGVQEARVFAFDAMVAKIREALKAVDATVTYGKPQHRPWDYLQPIKA